MAEEVKIKKRTIFTIIGIVLILGFVLFAFKNILLTKGNEITGDLVRGGETGSNKVINEGDTQIVNLGVANYNYDPNFITVESGKKVKIIGNMNQLQGCLRAFRIPNLGISKVFNSNDNVLEFTPTSKGTFGFTCSMGMGTGTLIVK